MADAAEAALQHRPHAQASCIDQSKVRASLLVGVDGWKSCEDLQAFYGWTAHACAKQGYEEVFDKLAASMERRSVGSMQENV